MKVALFVEDAAQLDFLSALVERIADIENVALDIQTRNAVGGRGVVETSLRRYVRDLSSGGAAYADILVVCIDSNCHGVNQTVATIREIVENAAYPGLLVCATPDPHIELWYLADGKAVSLAVGDDRPHLPLPAHKCERSRYKTLLREEFRRHEIDPPGGGAEYGREIAGLMDLNAARANQSAFDSFVADLGGALRQLAATLG